MLAMVASITLVGCSGGSSSSAPPNQPPAAPAPPAPAPEPEPTTVDFTAFVLDQFAATADDSDPESVDDIDFEFNDQEDPDAFSELLTGF